MNAKDLVVRSGKWFA